MKKINRQKKFKCFDLTFISTEEDTLQHIPS